MPSKLKIAKQKRIVAFGQGSSPITSGIDSLFQGIFERLERQQEQLNEISVGVQKTNLLIMSATQYAKSRGLRVQEVLRICHADGNGFPAAKMGERNWQIDAHMADQWFRSRFFQSMEQSEEL